MPELGPRRIAVASLVFWGVAVLLVGAVFLAGIAIQALLLTFAGVLFGVSLRGLVAWIARTLHCSIAIGFALAFGVGIGVGVVTAVWLLPRIIDQITELASEVTAAYHQVHAYLTSSNVGQRILDWLPAPASIGSLGRLTGWLTSTVGLLGSLLFVGFVALYIAISPDVYRGGVVRLVPRRHRDRADQVLDALARTLRRWLVARLVSMTAVGITTAVGLYMLGVPLPIALGAIAGVLGFIPNIGPIASAIPAVLLAATIGFPHVVYVGMLYLGVNLADGFVLTPIVQKQAVSTPAALVITSQLVFGALSGLLGVTLATPMIACVVVLVRMIYVEDILEAPNR